MAQKKIDDYFAVNNNLEVNKYYFKSKRGLARAVVESVSITMENFDAVIFLEDDCVVRPGGIQYFYDGLNDLKNDKTIRSICGYLYPVKNLIWGDNLELLKLKRFSTWGWSTWADRWKDYKKIEKILDIIQKKQININEFGNDIADICQNNSFLNGDRDIWSISWVLEHFISDSYAIFPRETYIDNIGMDGSGVHCKSTKIFNNSIHRSLFILRDWENIEYYNNNEIQIKEFMEVNSDAIY